jgi:hypothetical protein
VRKFRHVLLLQLRRDADELIEPRIERARRQLWVLVAHPQNEEVAVLAESRVETPDLLDRCFAGSQHGKLDLPLA